MNGSRMMANTSTRRGTCDVAICGEKDDKGKKWRLMCLRYSIL